MHLLAALLLALLLSGCMVQTGDPPVRICFPINDWRCSVNVPWADMTFR